MSDTLTSRCVDLKERAEARSRDARAQEEYARYEQSRQSLEDALAVIETVDEFAREATGAGIARLPLEDDRETAMVVAAKLRSELASALGHQVEELANQARDAVVVLAAHTSNRFELDFERWAESQPAPGDHVLNILEPDSPLAVERARDALHRFRALSVGAPATAKEIKDVAGAAAELRDAYIEVASTAPTTVQDFLERVPHGVPLGDIDQSVLEWLFDKGAASSFVVRLRR